MSPFKEPKEVRKSYNTRRPAAKAGGAAHPGPRRGGGPGSGEGICSQCNGKLSEE